MNDEKISLPLEVHIFSNRQNFAFLHQFDVDFDVYKKCKLPITHYEKNKILSRYDSQIAKFIGSKLKLMGIQIELDEDKVQSPWNLIHIQCYGIANHLNGQYVKPKFPKDNYPYNSWDQIIDDVFRSIQSCSVEFNVGKLQGCMIAVDMLDFKNPAAVIFLPVQFINDFFIFNQSAKVNSVTYKMNLPLEMGRDFVRGKISLETIFTWLHEKMVVKNMTPYVMK